MSKTDKSGGLIHITRNLLFLHFFLSQGISSAFFKWPTPQVSVFFLTNFQKYLSFYIFFQLFTCLLKWGVPVPRLSTPIVHSDVHLVRASEACLSSIFDSAAFFWEGKQCLFVETLKVLQADRCYINEISFQLLWLYYIELSYITITKERRLPTQQRPSSSWRYPYSPHK